MRTLSIFNKDKDQYRRKKQVLKKPSIYPGLSIRVAKLMMILNHTLKIEFKYCIKF